MLQLKTGWLVLAFWLVIGLLLAACNDTSGGGTNDDTDTDCSLGEYGGDAHITTPAELSALADYTSVEGFLSIACVECTDLDELVCLQSVGGDLGIGDTFAPDSELASISGLGSVSSVGGHLLVNFTELLDSLDGLGSITSVTGDLKIEYNKALDDMDALGSIESVGGQLYIRSNDLITDLDGLEALTDLGGELTVRGNDALPDCEVCELLEQLSEAPADMNVQDNLDDDCSPVPANCP